MSQQRQTWKNVVGYVFFLVFVAAASGLYTYWPEKIQRQPAAVGAWEKLKRSAFSLF
jgi:hypothetical protein